MTKIPELVQTKIDYYRWKEGYQKVMEEYGNRCNTKEYTNVFQITAEYPEKIGLFFDSKRVCTVKHPENTPYSESYMRYIYSFIGGKSDYLCSQPYFTTFDNIPYMVKSGMITKKYQDYIQEIS